MFRVLRFSLMFDPQELLSPRQTDAGRGESGGRMDFGGRGWLSLALPSCVTLRCSPTSLDLASLSGSTETKAKDPLSLSSGLPRSCCNRIPFSAPWGTGHWKEAKSSAC